MSERRKPYPFDLIEPKWQRVWQQRQAFHAPNPGEPGFDPNKPKFYILDMFPYPSGAGLHVGHPEGYTATDIVARYKRMRGCNVLHPMGWDAFGLPAEQYAIKTGQHPAITTRENVAHFKAQLKRIGFSYDWQREINTTDPAYYKWTQWIFLLIYNSYFDEKTHRARPIAELIAARKAQVADEPEEILRAFVDSKRLAYVADVPVNWCPQLGTVLANEEVIDGKSEIGGFPVVRRPMRQWMLRITALADRLEKELDGLDWPAGIKLLQRNWIGRSKGAEIQFEVAEASSLPDPALGQLQTRHTITVFTTRPDTLYGATYMVLAPEHPLVDDIASPEQRTAIESYRAESASKSDLERTDLAKEKTGVFTGAFALNPANGEPIPIWIADYVLMGYGTGAIMGVPAHDARDFEFARKFALPIQQVVARESSSQDASGMSELPIVEEGTAINSPIIDGLPTAAAKAKIIDWLEEHGRGRPDIRYKLRDWLFSRQRYWGEPFPIVWENEKHRPLAESELPLVAPELDDFKPTGTGDPPLAKAKEWVRYSQEAIRETNTMPQWAGSCWYYLRFCDPWNDSRFVGEEAERYWSGRNARRSVRGQDSAESHVEDAAHLGIVDLYVGGTEHAVLHLLYARFWHKVLFDLGYVSTPEPFQRLVNQGLILGEDGQKMSKSRGNVVSPDEVIDAYGTDALRCYEMFMGPLEQMKPWSMRGVEGIARFLARVWRLVMDENQAGDWILSQRVQEIAPDKGQLKLLHSTIRKVTEDIEALSFNTALSQMMVFVNAFTNAAAIPTSVLRTFLVLLNPFAPHLTSELWEKVGVNFSPGSADISEQTWPEWQAEHLVEHEIEIALQVNGKVRDRILVSLEATNETLEETALGNERVREFTAGRDVRRVVVVRNKLVNVVTS